MTPTPEYSVDKLAPRLVRSRTRVWCLADSENMALDIADALNDHVELRDKLGASAVRLQRSETTRAEQAELIRNLQDKLTSVRAERNSYRDGLNAAIAAKPARFKVDPAVVGMLQPMPEELRPQTQGDFKAAEKEYWRNLGILTHNDLAVETGNRHRCYLKLDKRVTQLERRADANANLREAAEHRIEDIKRYLSELHAWDNEPSSPDTQPPTLPW